MIDWNAAPIVAVYRPSCPECGHEKYLPNRGWKSGDGSHTSRRICERCSAVYIVISEPLPGSGVLENEIDRLPPVTTHQLERA